MKSVSGWSNPSTTLKDPIAIPRGTPIAAASKKPAVTRKKLILTSIQRFSSARKLIDASHTASGVGRKIGFTNSRWLSHTQETKVAANPVNASARYPQVGMSRRSSNHFVGSRGAACPRSSSRAPLEASIVDSGVVTSSRTADIALGVAACATQRFCPVAGIHPTRFQEAKYWRNLVATRAPDPYYVSPT